MKTESETRIELIDTKLLSAGWNVDNLSQVSQVSQEFDISISLPDGEKEISKDRRIYVSTYPGMMNIIKEEPLLSLPIFLI